MVADEATKELKEQPTKEVVVDQAMPAEDAAPAEAEAARVEAASQAAPQVASHTAQLLATDARLVCTVSLEASGR